VKTLHNYLSNSFFVVAMSLGCAASAALGQAMPLPVMADDSKAPAADKVPEFDVVSVKENKSDAHMMRIQYKADGFSDTNLSLKSLMAHVWGIRQDLISGGPGWADSIGFDVDAKVAGADVEALKKLNPTQRREMLKKVLEERFSLKLHTETKVLPVYDLVVAKGGPKFKETTLLPYKDDDPKGDDAPKRAGMTTMGNGVFKGDGIGIIGLVSELAYVEQRSVIDKTGLTGKYDIDLKWTPDRDTGGGSDEESSPSIFTALQEQLGLKLESDKGPVETLVIDHAEMPTQN
jgi:uncharacterized protein (TIGR03435 family)